MNAILFDLDGTLTDPKIGITTCIQYAIANLGYQPPATTDLLWCIGPPLSVSFAKLLETNDRNLVDKAISLYRDRFSTIGLFENLLYPDIPETLKLIRSEGYQTYVATSKPHVYAKRIIEHFGLSSMFDGIYGSELDGTNSIKSELIRHILDQENMAPAQTMMIGDRYHDVVGAKQNQVLAIGVTYGYGTEAELKEHGVDLLAHSPQEIPHLILNIY
ncbi:HAD hydrolase-like protein [Pseudanabaena sp. ABRG5-3]|uniref:HAD hydrolase-like protein n=1 Tax=Pseudanabaena sp. ABRG5-3 TaxID=685565 RepID=UPI000DC6D596|nr:HAD hydrolase-like protein [Pseudanabaena sp. ABRG5-3]BBC24471.1 HAD-superfamily hydrolase, subfamily IA, variant 1 [Pseudanabaena sp. ABRG5-3]